MRLVCQKHGERERNLVEVVVSKRKTAQEQTQKGREAGGENQRHSGMCESLETCPGLGYDP